MAAIRKKAALGLIVCFGMTTSSTFAQISLDARQVNLFPLDRVELLESPFKHAQDVNKKYLLDLEPDRLLAPYLREAGLIPKVESYTNWENSGLDGHIGGHYVTALSLMYASTRDADIKARLDYMLSELKRCQDNLGTGYIGGVPGSTLLWNDMQAGKIAAGNFDLNRKWVPLYNIHKIYAGLRDAYVIADISEAKEMLIKMTDWAVRLVEGLSEEQIQDMLRSEHGGLNEIFADVAVISGDDRYLKLAKQFTHESFLSPLIEHQDQLTGMHANTQIPKIIGVKRIADIVGEESWDSAARFFWETVVENRSVAIGGNSSYEHFHPIDDFSNMIHSVEGPETCNTYNMLKLSTQFFQTDEDVRYVDYYERALYNHILSTQHPEHGGFVYFTPMRPDHYRVYSQPHTSFWCCVGSGLENHSKYGEFIYAHRDDQLWVNLFIPSILDWQEKNVKITQQTSFPEESSTRLLIESAKRTQFELKLRYPSWVKEGEFEIFVNGKKQNIQSTPGQYVTLKKRWNKGDVVDIKFIMNSHVEQMPDGSDYYAFAYGPIVLASVSGTAQMDGLLADDSRGGHIAKGPQVPLREVPMVIGDKESLNKNPELISAKELRFALNNVYHNKQVGQRELVPFYQIHDARYIIYWPQAESREIADTRLASIENTFMATLDSLTVDRVNAGQQQPESDHNVQFEQSLTGADNGTQWREATGWFSYVLRNEDDNARFLYVSYFDKDRPSNFEVLIEGKQLIQVKLDGNRENVNYNVYELPKDFYSQEQMTVRFVAHNGSITARIVEVRLLSGMVSEEIETSF